MRFYSVNNWIKGLFEKKGTESRVPDNALIKCHNSNIDITGEVERRYGYTSKNMFQSGQAPIYVFENGKRVELYNNGKFTDKVQNFFEYVDVAGIKYHVVVCKGYVFIRRPGWNYWKVINQPYTGLSPTPLNNKINRLDITYYLDNIIINDEGQNVYYFNNRYSNTNIKFQIEKSYERAIYFAGNKIYFFNTNDFDNDTPTPITISGSTTDLEGKYIYASLEENLYEYKDDLRLGYSLKINDNYYVLDNGKNDRVIGTPTNKCQLLRFNNRLYYEESIELDMDETVSPQEVYNFAYKDGFIYINCKDGEINKINIQYGTFTGLDVIQTSDLEGLTNPVVGGKKIYSISIEDINGDIFLYSTTLPDKTDWYQPVIQGQYENDNKPEENYRYTFSKQGYLIAGTPPKIFVENNFRSAVLGIDCLIKQSDIDEEICRIKAKYFKYNPRLNGGYYPCYSRVYIDNMENYQNNKLIPLAWRYENQIITDGYWFLDETKYPYSMAIEDKIYSDFENYKLIYNIDFQFGNELSEKNVFYFDIGWNHTLYNAIVEIHRIDENVFYLKDDNIYNSDIFTDKNTSKYVLLVKLTNTGVLYSEQVKTVNEGYKKWRFILPLGYINQCVDLTPLLYEEPFIIFGCRMNNEEDGRMIRYNINNNEYITTDTFYSHRRYMINESKWGISNDGELKKFMGFEWDYLNAQTNSGWWKGTFTDFLNYNSNLMFVSRIQTSEEIKEIIGNELLPIGTTKPVLMKLVSDGAATFNDGDIVTYKTSLVFYNGNKTLLSSDSWVHTFKDQSIYGKQRIDIIELNLLDPLGVEIWNKEDIEYIELYRSLNDGLFYRIATLEKDSSDDWYVGGDAHTYPKETVEDTNLSNQEIFNDKDVIRYSVNDIFIHKNRLILVNFINFENQNVCGYSPLDQIQAISPLNIRPVESGDMDYLVTGKSMGDYAYLFKSKKIYAVLGDFPTGQLIDVDKKIGCKYKNLITVFENRIYFMNDFSIYMIDNLKVIDIHQQRLYNYFDKNNENGIDFDNLKEGFADVDVENREILFYVPLKDVKTNIDKRNNFIIVYNVDYNYFKTRGYADKIYNACYINNEYYLSGYNSDIYKIEKRKNDNNKPIEWNIKTKEFNIGSDIISKIYKIIKVAGTYFTDLKITYWIDGKRYTGVLNYRKTESQYTSAFLKLWNRGKGMRIAIEISGRDLNNPPSKISEILIGYEMTRTLR